MFTPPRRTRLGFITGATSGIGAGVALALARDGFELIIIGRNQVRKQCSTLLSSSNLQPNTLHLLHAIGAGDTGTASCRV